MASHPANRIGGCGIENRERPDDSSREQSFFDRERRALQNVNGVAYRDIESEYVSARLLNRGKVGLPKLHAIRGRALTELVSHDNAPPDLTDEERRLVEIEAFFVANERAQERPLGSAR